MTTPIKKTSTLSLLLFISFSIILANGTPWTAVRETDFAQPDHERQIVPQQYLVYSLNMESLAALLAEAPLRFSPASHGTPVVLKVPLPNGSMESFQIFDAPIMHPDLAKKYQMIRAYAGVGLDDKTATLRFDVTQFGFHAMILSGQHDAVFIDPYAKGDTRHYISYYQNDFKKELRSQCYFDDAPTDLSNLIVTGTSGAGLFQGDCKLRTYRLALACTGEYAAFHGGNLTDVMAAVHTTMTRVNGIFEKDVAVSMELIANNDELIYLNAATDPYNFFSSGENQVVIDDVIGTANYDISHLLGIGPGGEAERSSCCVEGLKASAASTLSSPVGDPFDINFVAHEFGHQFGCSHTAHNDCNNTPATSVETGNGASVMGQDFFCDPVLEFVRGAYFHAINILEIQQNIAGPAGSCPVLTDMGNTPPTVDGGNSRYVVPVSTPFKLTATGSDADGNALTYCWEQMDNENAPNPPLPSNVAGPAFRSFEPVDEPHRYFPALQNIVNGTNPQWEVLPDVGRQMNFRVTVRDNFMGSGCTGEDDVDLNFTEAAGPFLVQHPNANETWLQGAFQTVTWDVANTDVAPVGCSHVDILLSTDGGLTYPIVLRSDAPNDGAQKILVPNISTNSARIMVFCSDNIFFDISDENFSIEEPSSPTVVSSIDPPVQEVCGMVADAVYDLSFRPLSGFNEEITLSVTGVPAGASFSLSQTTFTPPLSQLFYIEDLENVLPGNYTIHVSATSASATLAQEITLTVENDLPDQIVLAAPENYAVDEPLTPTFSWEGGGNSGDYIFELATSPGFGSSVVAINTTNTNNYTLSKNLAPFTVYYWRIRSENVCVENTPSFSFQTGADGCFEFINDEPALVPGFIATETSTIFVEKDLEILDANISMQVFHKFIGDLTVTLTSPAGTSIELFSRPGVPATPIGCSRDDLLVTFDDEAGNAASVFENSCVSGTDYAIEGIFQPITPLSNLQGESTFGVWTLTVADDKFSHAGSIDNWSLEFCFSEEAGAAPDFSKMDLEAPGLGSAVVLNDNLLASSPTAGPAEIAYKLMALPSEGNLLLSGSLAELETTFTQEDINNGLLRYANTNPDAISDQFRFNITTSEGGVIQDEFLNINIGPVNSLHETGTDLSFELFPNPSTGTMNLILDQETRAGLQLRIFDIAGKLLQDKKVEKQGSFLQYSINVHHFSAGSYYMILSDGQSVGRKRFVKM
ncbi:MAG: reprolysin-like metallopeptidase [Bacteroidota bacterium]